MKLLLCDACDDLFRLYPHERTCLCGKTRGAYDDNGKTAYYNGQGIPLGLDNDTIPLLIYGRASAVALQVLKGPFTKVGERMQGETHSLEARDKSDRAEDGLAVRMGWGPGPYSQELEDDAILGREEEKDD